MKAKTAFPSPKGGCCDLGTESDSVLWTPPRWYGLKRWINGLLFGMQRKIHDIAAGGARPHPCEGTPVQEAETVPRGVVPKRVMKYCRTSAAAPATAGWEWLVPDEAV